MLSGKRNSGSDPKGFLAIWCEMAASDLEDYRNWLTREHIADRTFSPGFLSVRLFEAVDNMRSHFILYATENADVLRGAAYKNILDNPSPWTRRIMPKFGPFDRALGEQMMKVGNGFGAHVAIWRLQVPTADCDWAMIEAHLRKVIETSGIVSVRAFQVDRGVTERASEEKTMRSGGEGEFDVLLCAEAMSEQAAQRAERALSQKLPELFPCLENHQSSCFRMIYGEAAHEGETPSSLD